MGEAEGPRKVALASRGQCSQVSGPHLSPSEQAQTSSQAFWCSAHVPGGLVWFSRLHVMSQWLGPHEISFTQ